MPDLPPCRWSARRVVRCRPSRCRCRAPCCTFRRAGPSPRDAAEVADLVARRHSSGWVLVERRGDRGERRRVSNRCAGLAPRPRTGPSQESRPPRGTDTVPGARPAHHGSAFARIDRIPIAVRLARPVEMAKYPQRTQCCEVGRSARDGSLVSGSGRLLRSGRPIQRLERRRMW